MCRLLLGGAVSFVLLAAACGSSNPPTTAASPSPTATPAHQHVLARGTVTTVSPSSLSLTTKGGTETLQLAADVTVKQSGRTVPLSTVVPGDSVVLYAASGSGSAPGGGGVVGRIVVKSAAGGASPTPTS